MDELNWEDYLQAPLDPEMLSNCSMRSELMLQEQRGILRHLAEVLQPRRVACLGSGYLNDIPIDALVPGRELYLVDWIPAISEAGIVNRLITEGDGSYACLLCDERCDPKQYCEAYSGTSESRNMICGNFQPVEEPTLHCASYIPGPEFHFIISDVTLGRADWFGKRAHQWVHQAKTPQQAVKKAISECRRYHGLDATLPIPTGGIDLVTSSLVISQFDHEPYGYFSKVLRQHFSGPRLASRIALLEPLIEQLRSELFAIQVEAHIQELYRIVEKRHGRVYLSVETFRSVPGEDQFFLVHDIPQALEVMGEYFHFDYNLLPPEQSLRISPSGEGNSLVQGFVLSPISK